MYTNTYVQKKAISDQRCSRTLNFKTETWSKLQDWDFIKKIRDSSFETDTKTWKFVDYHNIFLKILQKMSSPPRSFNFFKFLAFFIRALVVSHLQIQQKKSMLN